MIGNYPFIVWCDEIDRYRALIKDDEFEDMKYFGFKYFKGFKRYEDAVWFKLRSKIRSLRLIDNSDHRFTDALNDLEKKERQSDMMAYELAVSELNALIMA